LSGDARPVGPLDEDAARAAAERLDRLTKPPGSLGRLEALAIQLAGIRGALVTDIRRPAIAVFAADHGVTAQGVSPYPSAVTRQMVANFLAGGAAVSVLARAAGADLVVVDVGIAGEPIMAPASNEDAPSVRFEAARIADGTRDLSAEPAMTVLQAGAAIAAGRRVAGDLVDRGADLVALGEMGIGNTTAASALVAALTGRPAADVTGRGTGLDAAGVQRKAALIDEALRRHRPASSDPMGTLARVGGLEIAALVGAIQETASRRVPILLDGFITGAAALVAARLDPSLPPHLIAAHRSTEPGHRIALDTLGLDPVLDLDLRLGEGSGAALAIPLVRAAARILGEMATFDEAAVSNRD
ncbi:MAG TPA: nicotinate-nucleotide--dimethylbenzimidazole phosphoribosyltransferase, partial [Candidatus Limnocylindrales bacterium]|nr:nicotinate-nucleotide--dimethylbenzimidazole phosphoribosyltransferase [Candidatus Limnocylindrales bacterium]